MIITIDVGYVLKAKLKVGWKHDTNLGWLFLTFLIANPNHCHFTSFRNRISFATNQTEKKMKTVKEHLEEAKSVVEGLNLQLHLGKAEAEKAFEEQKAGLRDWSVKMKMKVDEAKELNQEHSDKLIATLEELRLQAALGKATTKDLLKEQQQELKKRMEQLRSDVDLVFETSKEHSDDLLEELSLRLHDYQVKFDIFKLQLQLAKMESELEIEKRKKDAAHKLKELQHELDKKAEEASDKLENFSKEMAHAWKHVRKAFD